MGMWIFIVKMAMTVDLSVLWEGITHLCASCEQSDTVLRCILMMELKLCPKTTCSTIMK